MNGFPAVHILDEDKFREHVYKRNDRRRMQETVAEEFLNSTEVDTPFDEVMIIEAIITTVGVTGKS